MRTQNQAEQQQIQQAQAMNPLLLQQQLRTAADQRQADELAAVNASAAAAAQRFPVPTGAKANAPATPVSGAASTAGSSADPAAVQPMSTMANTGPLPAGGPSVSTQPPLPVNLDPRFITTPPVAPPPGAPPNSSTAAPPPGLPPYYYAQAPPGAGTVVPASAMGNSAASGYVAPTAAANAPPAPAPASDNAGPGPAAMSAAASAGQAATATAPQPPTAAQMDEQRDAEFARQMTARGFAAAVPKYMDALSTARSNAIKAQEAQQDQDDQQIMKAANVDGRGTPATVLQLAQDRGISFKGLSSLQGYYAGLAANKVAAGQHLADLGESQNKLLTSNSDLLGKRLAAYAQGDVNPETWRQWITDNSDLMEEAHVKATLAAHPDQPPSPEVLQNYVRLLRTDAAVGQAAQSTILQASAARVQRDDLITSLQGQHDAASYNQVLDGSPVPHTDIPRGEAMFDPKTGGPIAAASSCSTAWPSAAKSGARRRSR